MGGLLVRSCCRVPMTRSKSKKVDECNPVNPPHDPAGLKS